MRDVCLIAVTNATRHLLDTNEVVKSPEPTSPSIPGHVALHHLPNELSPWPGEKHVKEQISTQCCEDLYSFPGEGEILEELD